MKETTAFNKFTRALREEREFFLSWTGYTREEYEKLTIQDIKDLQYKLQ